MSGVFQNIEPPPPHPLASVYPPPLERWEDTLAGWRGGGGLIFQKTPDIRFASYSIIPLRIYPSIFHPPKLTPHNLCFCEPI